MPRKLVGYILLSSLSFCFFTVVFNVIATTQASADQSSAQPENISPIQLVPTPTIFKAPAVSPDQTQTPLLEKNLPSPTPTIFIQKVSTSQIEETVQPTETPVPPTATPTPTDVPTETPSPSPSPEPTVATTTDLETLFSKYSSQYSVSEDELKKIANCESGFNTNSDTGVYAGMFQFSASTWASVRGLMGLDPNPDLRKDSEQAIMTTAFMLSRGEENAWPNCH